MNKINWDDLKQSANDFLIGCGDNCDYKFAIHLWSLMEAKGLTKYKNEIEKNKVLVLFLSMIEFVNDCTSLARDENYETDANTWAMYRGVSPFRIGQLIGDKFDTETEYEEDEIFENAILYLFDEYREEVIFCITSKYNNSIEIMKFIGSFYMDEEQDVDINDQENYSVPVLTMMFYEWVEEGMSRRN